MATRRSQSTTNIWKIVQMFCKVSVKMWSMVSFLHNKIGSCSDLKNVIFEVYFTLRFSFSKEYVMLSISLWFKPWVKKSELFNVMSVKLFPLKQSELKTYSSKHHFNVVLFKASPQGGLDNEEIKYGMIKEFWNYVAFDATEDSNTVESNRNLEK